MQTPFPFGTLFEVLLTCVRRAWVAPKVHPRRLCQSLAEPKTAIVKTNSGRSFHCNKKYTVDNKSARCWLKKRRLFVELAE